MRPLPEEEAVGDEEHGAGRQVVRIDGRGQEEADALEREERDDDDRVEREEDDRVVRDATKPKEDDQVEEGLGEHGHEEDRRGDRVPVRSELILTLRAWYRRAR